MKKLNADALNSVRVAVTQERIAPSPDMPPVSMEGVTIIPPAPPSAAPAAVADPVVEVAPQVTPDVKPPEASSTPEGTSPVSSGETKAENTSANASTDETDSELKEDELPEGIRKRFSKLTTKRKEAESKAKALEEEILKHDREKEASKKELEFYKELLMNPSIKPNATVATRVDQTPVKTEDKAPVFEDFAGEADPITAFVDAKANYLINKRMAPVEKAMDPATIERKRQLDAIVSENPDFINVVNFENPAIKLLSQNPVTNAMIPASKDNLKLAYYFAKNPTEAQRVAQLTDPIDVGVALREIQNKMSPQKVQETKQTEVPAPAVRVSTPEQKPIQQTQAPVPFKPVNPVGTAGLPPVDQLTPDQLRSDPRYSHLFKRR